MNPQRLCIFCRQPSGTPSPVEHIIPESLWPIDWLVLDDGDVCGECNNRLSRVDKLLIERLSLFRALHGATRTKKGRRTFSNNGNIAITPSPRTPDGIELEVDILRPGPGRRLEVTPDGGVSFDVVLRVDEGIQRGLHKIAMEYLCKKRGAEFVCDSRFDDARHFVCGRSGKRDLLMRTPSEEFVVGAIPPNISLACWGWRGLGVVEVCLFGIVFLLILDGGTEELLGYAEERNRKSGRKTYFLPDPSRGPQTTDGQLIARMFDREYGRDDSRAEGWGARRVGGFGAR